jgi:uncharacterized protein (TIGR02145 family)
MNEIIILRICQVLLLGNLLFLTGCSEKNIESSKPDLLTSTWWKYNWDIGGIDPDFEEIYWLFKPNGEYYQDNGYQGTWSLEDNDQTLILEGYSLMQAYSITSLTESTLKFKYKYVEGGHMSFTALSGTKLKSVGVSSLTRNSAKLHGIVRTNKKAAETVEFEYGITTSYGAKVSAAIGNIAPLTLPEIIDATVPDLNLETTYHYRIKATCGSETFFGQDLIFRMFNTETLSDYNGNIYNTVTVGNQTWMAENLRAVNYNDGTPISLVTENTSWGTATTSAYCWYNNDAATYKNQYGAIYNWYAVKTGKLCPAGWHVPGEQDWTVLQQNLGTDAGSKLFEYGINSTGFSASNAGFRWDGDGTFTLSFPFFWTSDEDGSANAFRYAIDMVVTKYSSPKESGFSVRCIKD